MCFSHADKVNKDGSSAGLLTLGGADERIHKSPMVYAQNHDVNGWYSIYVAGMYLKYQKDGDEEKDAKVVKLNLDVQKVNENSVIVDSGTTESFVPSSIEAPFKEAFKELMDFDFDSSVAATTSDDEDGINPMEDYPTIMIQLKAAIHVKDDELMDDNGHPLDGLVGRLDLDAPNDVILEIPPQNYMLLKKSSNTYVNRFHMNENSSFGVLGANAMYGHDLLFDTDKNRIGFAKSSCEYSLLAEDAADR